MIPSETARDVDLHLGALLMEPVLVWAAAHGIRRLARAASDGLTLLCARLPDGRLAWLTWHDDPDDEPPTPFLRAFVTGRQCGRCDALGVFDALDPALAFLTVMVAASERVA